MDNCLFCKICAKETDTIVLFEDDDVLAFKDINPQAPVHLLVIPKAHIESADDLAEEHGALLGKLFATIARLADEQGLQDGYRVVTNIGDDGGQSVKHLHFHVLGGRQMGWPPG